MLKNKVLFNSTEIIWANFEELFEFSNRLDGAIFSVDHHCANYTSKIPISNNSPEVSKRICTSKSICTLQKHRTF